MDDPRTAHSGRWVVCVTFQGGGLIDEVDGPYWSKDEATQARNSQRSDAQRLKRTDRFRVALLAMDDDDD